MAEYTLNLFDPAAEPPKQERGTITVSVEELTQTRNLVSHPLHASLPVTRAVACEMLAWLLFNSPRRVLPARIFLLSSRCFVVLATRNARSPTSRRLSLAPRSLD
jgi:hypothetical protein